jgi:hypothetical protein
MRLIKLVLAAALAAGALMSATGTGAVAEKAPDAVREGPITVAQALRQVQAAARAGIMTESGYFYLHVAARGDAYCLDNFASGGGANNSPVGLWACNSGVTERWYLRNLGTNSVYDLNLVNAGSGRCLDYPATAGNNIGWQFNVYDCKNGAARGQNFAVTQPNGAGLVFLSQATTHTVAMDAFADFWHGNGSPVGLWTYTVPGTSLQNWNYTA